MGCKLQAREIRLLTESAYTRYRCFHRSEEITLYLKMAADTSVEILQKVLENEILQTAKVVEEHLDAEMQKLDQMDEDELEHLKQRRLEALKKAQQQKQVILILT